MSIPKKVQKFWSGSANFKVSEIFNSVSAAYNKLSLVTLLFMRLMINPSALSLLG